MMVLIGWLVLCVCFASLLFVLIRNRHSRQWLAYLMLNIGLAVFILYFINLIGVRLSIDIPINMMTIATIGVLGIPGLLLLVALKLTLF